MKWPGDFWTALLIVGVLFLSDYFLFDYSFSDALIGVAMRLVIVLLAMTAIRWLQRKVVLKKNR